MLLCWFVEMSVLCLELLFMIKQGMQTHLSPLRPLQQAIASSLAGTQCVHYFLEHLCMSRVLDQLVIDPASKESERHTN